MKNRKVLIICNIIACVCFGITAYINLTNKDTMMAVITGIASVSSLLSLVLNIKAEKEDNK